MDEIVKHYRDSKTPHGHELRVDERDDETIIWYLYWGEYGGVDDHHHMGIARVRSAGSGFEIGWLHGTDQEPYRTEQVTDLKELYAKIDAEIANR